MNDTEVGFLYLDKVKSKLTKLSHVNIYIDNTTEEAYINSMDRTHFLGCNEISHDIWTLCTPRNIWVKLFHYQVEKC